MTTKKPNCRTFKDTLRTTDKDAILDRINRTDTSHLASYCRSAQGKEGPQKSVELGPGFGQNLGIRNRGGISAAHLRALFYRLVMTRGFPDVHAAYKLLVRWSKRWREEDSWLMEKFVDLVRRPSIPKPPSISELEIWLEKHATLVLLQDLLEKFRVPVQITRGYASISCLRDALRRAEKKGIKKILYFGDLDPSGLDIERVTRKKLPISMRKIALTWSQVERYNLPQKPCKPKDRRTPNYIAKWGNFAYELEALDIRILREITERELRKLIPSGYLRELERREEVERVAVELVRELLELGVSPGEVTRRLKRLRRK